MNDIDYGPLTQLIGEWQGNKGHDVSPEPDGQSETPYIDRIVFEPLGIATNAETQQLAVLRYTQIVRRISNGEAFHDQVGYWMWDLKSDTVMQSLLIPRGVGILAGGRYSGTAHSGNGIAIEVAAKFDDPHWGIVQSPFMSEKARTLAYNHCLRVQGTTLEYAQTTLLQIYGKTFEHTDGNSLTKV